MLVYLVWDGFDLHHPDSVWINPLKAQTRAEEINKQHAESQHYWKHGLKAYVEDIATGDE